MPEPIIHNIFEPNTGSWQYIVADPSTSSAVIIDPVLNYDAATAKITTDNADSLLKLVNEHKYKVEMILETHAHADHLTAAGYLRTKLGKSQGRTTPIGIGERILQVQKYWAEKYNVPTEEWKGAFDVLLGDKEAFKIGELTAVAMHLPGHTPDHMGYMIGDNVFVGDSMFKADLGSARADFPGGDAKTLFQSGKKLLSLPDHVKIWSGHDYPPEDQKGRQPWTTVCDQRQQNKHFKNSVDEDDYVALRSQRDSTLSEPKLLHQALQINIRAGRLPLPSSSGIRVVQMPLKVDGVAW